MQPTIPPSLLSVLSDYHFVIADAGAAGGIHARWSMLDRGLKVLGFEPDGREFCRLPKGDNYIWFNAALGDRESEVTLQVTRHQTNTSLLLPNRGVVDRIYRNPADFDVMKEVVVDCTTLDTACQIAGVDVSALKADTQGTELSILQGGQRSLAQTLVTVELEVEFVQLYKDQPLFPDIDVFMRNHGFMLVDRGNLLCHKWRQSVNLGGRKGQLLAADALYLRSPESLDELLRACDNPLKLFTHYWAACAVYGYLDLAYEVSLEYLDSPWMTPAVARDIRRWADRAVRDVSTRPVRGRGRIATWLRKLADKVEPRNQSVWVNPLGNE